MFLLTVQYINLYNNLEQLQFLVPQIDIGNYEFPFMTFHTVDNVKVTLDKKRIYLSTVAPYTPPTDTADEAKLSEG